MVPALTEGLIFPGRLSPLTGRPAPPFTGRLPLARPLTAPPGAEEVLLVQDRPASEAAVLAEGLPDLEAAAAVLPAPAAEVPAAAADSAGNNL